MLCPCVLHAAAALLSKQRRVLQAFTVKCVTQLCSWTEVCSLPLSDRSDGVWMEAGVLSCIHNLYGCNAYTHIWSLMLGNRLPVWSIPSNKLHYLSESCIKNEFSTVRGQVRFRPVSYSSLTYLQPDKSVLKMYIEAKPVIPTSVCVKAQVWY